MEQDGNKFCKQDVFDEWKALYKGHKHQFMILNVKKRVFVEHKAEATKYDEDMSREDYDAGR